MSYFSTIKSGYYDNKNIEMRAGDLTYFILLSNSEYFDKQALIDYELAYHSLKDGKILITNHLRYYFDGFKLSGSEEKAIREIALYLSDNGWSPRRQTPTSSLISSMVGTDDDPNVVSGKKKAKPKTTVVEGVDTEGVWQLIRKGTTKDSRFRGATDPSHLYAIKWERYEKGRKGKGNLVVAFASGGGVKGNTLPVYAYPSITYDQYYELWKRVSSPGSWLWKNAITAKGGMKLGSINKNQIQAELFRS